MSEHPIIKLMALAIIKRDGEDPAHWKGNVPVSTAALEPTTDPDGWIEWKGGDNPCGKYVFADIKLRGGNTWYNMPARLILWKHENAGNDTIAYRIHKGEPKPMSEHPIIKLMALAIIKRDGEDPAHWKGNVPVSTAALTTALQWLADPANLSDDVVEAVAIARYVDAGVDNNDPATWVSYPEACKAEYRMSARNMITAFANALLKEIEE